MDDIKIANLSKKKNIKEIASKLGLKEELLYCYGDEIAKIDYRQVKNNKDGKLILVTAINPTSYGEGKTTISIGLLDALNYIGKNAVAALREPSLGPVFGFKGGACGGGYSQMVPMAEINLHFTGDLHAITAANNLIVAAAENHIYQGNKLDIKTIVFKRCLDVNDRSLRENFNITAASEIMSVFCLAENTKDLNEKLANIIVAYDREDKAIYVRDLKLNDSLTVILKDALKPNLVQSLENNPVIVHGGPFANIAHGCNSIIATKLAKKLADYVVTEAGFGADLGAEKFFDIKCRKADIAPDCVVLVATTKALKYNSMMENIEEENEEAIIKGLPNLGVHIQNLKKFNKNVIVCLNKYKSDSEKEIKLIRQYCKNIGITFTISESFADGGKGAEDFAKKVVEICENKNEFNFLYKDELSVKEKIEKVCKEIYRAGEIDYSTEALDTLKQIDKLSLSHLPICISKTQYSLSDNPKLLGAPSGFKISVRSIEIYSGAGFITVILGKTIRMPGLPANPNYEKIRLEEDGQVAGLM